MRALLVLVMALAIAGCDYTEVKREIGYKGKARLNPWLAAERFCAAYEGDVRSLAAWEPPAEGDVLWFAPAAALGNGSFIGQVEAWVENGGHLVLLVENADPTVSDWSRRDNGTLPEPALVKWLQRVGLPLESSDLPVSATTITLEDETFDVQAKSGSRIAVPGERPGVFASVSLGDGRLTVLTDARIFRNRWIGDKQHADLLDALVRITDYEGDICFLRGSGMSLWGMLSTYLWPVLLGLGVLTVLWLWKNLSRFGPVESAEGAATLRGYDHHLEALGNFQWRFDRCVTLLAPLRNRIIERGQHLAATSGRRDEDFFQFLAERSGLPRERVARALAEPTVPDSSILTRTAADLQHLLQTLH